MRVKLVLRVSECQRATSVEEWLLPNELWESREQREREDREVLCAAWLSAAGVGVVCVWTGTSEEQCVGSTEGEIPPQTGGNLKCLYTLSCLQSLSYLFLSCFKYTCSTKPIEQRGSVFISQLSGSGSIFLSLVSMCANCPFSAIYYSFSHSNLNWNSP